MCPRTEARLTYYQSAARDTSVVVAGGTDATSIVVTVPVGTTQYWARVTGQDPGHGDPNNGCECYRDSAAVMVTR
jgi:hypothetical protein